MDIHTPVNNEGFEADIRLVFQLAVLVDADWLKTERPDPTTTQLYLFSPALAYFFNDYKSMEPGNFGLGDSYGALPSDFLGAL